MSKKYDDLVTSSDIATMAGVTRPVITGWKKRHDDFPTPVATVPGKDIYKRADVEEWLLVLSERRLDQAVAALELARANVVKAETTLKQARTFFRRFRN